MANDDADGKKRMGRIVWIAEQGPVRAAEGRFMAGTAKKGRSDDRNKEKRGEMNMTNRKRLTAALILALTACLMVLPAMADAYATGGSGGSTSIFFVESYGNATLTFSQSEGLCYELSYTHAIDGILGNEDEWGKYHIYVETPGGGSYREDWDKTFGGGSYSLKLNGAGIYRIRVVPYTADEMTASWTLDKFISWTAYPRWWISGQKNCAAKTTVSASIYVYQVDQDTGAVLSSRSETVSYGSNTVSAGSAPSGYALSSSSMASVYVDQTGRADVSSVTFYYRKKAPASASLSVYCYDENGGVICTYTESVSSSGYVSPRVLDGYSVTSGSAYVRFDAASGACDPGSVSFSYRRNISAPPAPSYGRVTPSSWDTQFRPGFCRDTNDEQYRYLSRLGDDNASTAFWWVIWRTEREDSIPELTAFFNGDTVSTISIRNGNMSNYQAYARAARFRVCVYHAGGVTTAYVCLPDRFTRDYQTFSLGGTYQGVSRIEMYLDGGDGVGFYSGSYEPYYIYVTDILFGS